MGILKKIGMGLLKAVVPSISKERNKVSSVDTLLSKQGECKNGELVLALTYKIIRLLLMAGLVYAIISGKVTVLELTKAITAVTSIGL